MITQARSDKLDLAHSVLSIPDDECHFLLTEKQHGDWKESGSVKDRLI